MLLQKSTPNLEGAFKYLKQHVGNKPLTSEVIHGLEEAAGVGVVITPQQIDATVHHHISKVKPQLVEQRYEACLSASLGTRLTSYLSLQCQSCLLGLLPICQLLLFLSTLQPPESSYPTHYSTQILLLSVADTCKPQTGTPQSPHSLAACARYIHHSTDVTFSAAVIQPSQA